MFIDILVAVAVLMGTGVLAAVILALASYYLNVPVDDTVRKIRECLPGANCGACGYAGCDAYAEALSNGDASPNRCIPGGNAVAKSAAEILGVEAKEIAELVAYVHCNGTPEATERVAEYDGLMTCSAMCLSCAGPAACKYGCLGCGDCAHICPVRAICITDGIARVDPAKCISCGLCVKTCPKHIISIIPRDARVAVICSSHDSGAATRKKCTRGCIACGKCEKTCPYGAIKVENSLAVVDYEKCTGCGMCAEVCPVRCIAQVGKFNEEFRK